MTDDFLVFVAATQGYCAVLKGPGLSPVSGGYGEGETPLPFPNRAVKPLSADGTWPARARESRSPPVYLRTGRPHGRPVRRCARWFAAWYPALRFPGGNAALWFAGGYAGWFAVSAALHGWRRAGTAPSRRSCDSSVRGRARPRAQQTPRSAPVLAGRRRGPSAAERAGPAGSLRPASGSPAAGRRRVAPSDGRNAGGSSRKAKAFA